MGLIFARFRKEKTTTEILEHLEERIKAIEKFSVTTQEQKKRFVGSFLAISIGLYVIAFIICCFVYFPQTWKARILYAIPMLLFPVIILMLRKALQWYFERKLQKNTLKLTDLRVEKKKILEQVMDKETYKVAVELLNRFGDRATASRALYGMTPRVNASQPSRTQNLVSSTPTLRPGLTPIAKPNAANVSPAVAPILTSLQISGINAKPSSPAISSHSTALGQNRSLPNRSTPFPILNLQDKSVFERIVDILVGDGPQDRFGMICKECKAHNGMAPADEWEFATFRCAFCNFLNKARKERPVAPRLSMNVPLPLPNHDSSESASSDDSDDDNHTMRQRNLSASPLLPLKQKEEEDADNSGSASDEASKTERMVSDAESRHQERQDALLKNDPEIVESLLKGELKKHR